VEVFIINSIDKQRIIDNFKLRNIQVLFFENKQQLIDKAMSIIPKEASIGVGNSATVKAIGIVEELSKRGNIVYDKSKAETKEEIRELKRKSLLTDWFISSANAISCEGHIVNIDHSGNRVAALTYGPDNVIIIVGMNKLVNTLEEAVNRAKNTASPKNAKRAGFNPPCVSIGQCIDCKSDQRVCHYLSIIQGQHEKNRMRLFIVEEEYGF
jgi:L-lactate utilization protein LutC